MPGGVLNCRLNGWFWPEYNGPEIAAPPTPTPASSIVAPSTTFISNLSGAAWEASVQPADVFGVQLANRQIGDRALHLRMSYSHEHLPLSHHCAATLRAAFHMLQHAPERSRVLSPHSHIPAAARPYLEQFTIGCILAHSWHGHLARVHGLEGRATRSQPFVKCSNVLCADASSTGITVPQTQGAMRPRRGAGGARF